MNQVDNPGYCQLAEPGKRVVKPKGKLPLGGHHYLSWTICIELDAAVGRAGWRARSNSFDQRRKILAMAAKTHICLHVLRS